MAAYANPQLYLYTIKVREYVNMLYDRGGGLNTSVANLKLRELKAYCHAFMHGKARFICSERRVKCLF